MFAKTPATLAVLALSACATPPVVPALTDPAPAQRAWAAACADFDEWDKPGPPFRIFGNSYYVGTCGISAVLIVSPEGHTLIDSGTDTGAGIVLDNIRKLGFEPKDVTVLLASHEHVDHVGGMARLLAATGAKLVASPAAAAVLRSGKASPEDPQFGGLPAFSPAKVAHELEFRDGKASILNGTEFAGYATPGHTAGATSWQWRECERSRCETIVYADSLSAVGAKAYRFSDHQGLVAAFRASIARVSGLECGIVLAPHPGAVALRARLSGERPLIDPSGCRTFARDVAARLDKRLAEEAAAR